MKSTTRSPWFAPSSVLAHVFIVPDAQRRIFDVEYQLYVFELFHQRGVNRWSHFLGIPLHMAALYCLLLRLPIVGPAIIAACIGVHLAIIFRSSLRSLPLMVWVLTVHLALLTSVWAWFGPSVLDGSSVLRSPALHLLLWPALQYVTHAIERDLPAPWSLEGAWTPMTKFLREASWLRLGALGLCLPFHVGVELLSSWRNFLLVVVGAGEDLGLDGGRVAVLRRKIEREMERPDPAFDAVTFARRAAGTQGQQGPSMSLGQSLDGARESAA